MHQNMLKLIIILLIVGILTAAPKNPPKKSTGFSYLPSEFTDIVKSKLITTTDLPNTPAVYRRLGQRLRDYLYSCGLDSYRKDLTLRFQSPGKISKECCGLIEETAHLFKRIEFHGFANIISGDKCIPKGIKISKLFINTKC